ncbi:MAG: ATP-dependent endonuclease [Phycisphaerales bacterium]
MKLKTVYVRCYKSFNFDYLRKVHAEARFDPWDMLDGSPYPYLRIALDPEVTTVVGANESGKSHLLSAIEKGLTGEGIEREDFCRYSQFFTVEDGKTRSPEFGFEFVDLQPADTQAVLDACGIADHGFDRFLLFRTTTGNLTVYLPSRDKYSNHPVIAGKERGLIAVLPRVFRIKPDVALPDGVPILSLLGDTGDGTKTSAANISREKRFDVLEKIAAVAGQSAMFATDEAVKSNAPAIRASMSSILQAARTVDRGTAGNGDGATELARDMLFKVAKVDRGAVRDLYDALREGNDGHANGLVQKINQHLAATLNFPHWWVQDRDFQLVVTPRDYDLVLTIRDRTGTDYSFSERSGGLKYFLSYYVQYRAHTPVDTRPEILLMDEPDAHLSSEGQQDLLKIFDAFANPMDGRRAVQIVYVTHSPFLIDKNHAERIRVLEKGVSEEGTRIVRDAARNHYEPLRSAFGAFVGETTFIGNCNLVVEGLSDQVLLAGAATQLRKSRSAESETLDLNHLTIVPAGSASHVPYLVFLARGRDIEQPAVIVLLDSDTAGDEAVQAIKRGGPRRKQLLRNELVIQVAAVTGVAAAVREVVSVEDLIPLDIAVRAAHAYGKEFCDFDADDRAKITAEAVRNAFNPARGVFEALAGVFAGVRDERPHLDKVGFARSVLEVTQSLRINGASGNMDAKALVESFDHNFRGLFAKLNHMRRDAERESRGDRVSSRVERAKRSFVLDHPKIATKEQAALLLEDIEAVLDQTFESDEVRNHVQRLRREFQLDVNLTEPIGDLAAFKEQLERLRYAGRLATQERMSETSTAPIPGPVTSVVEPKGEPPKEAQPVTSTAPARSAAPNG